MSQATKAQGSTHFSGQQRYIAAMHYLKALCAHCECIWLKLCTLVRNGQWCSQKYLELLHCALKCHPEKVKLHAVAKLQSCPQLMTAYTTTASAAMMVTSAQFSQTWAVASQSQRQLSTYLPGFKSDGTLTLSLIAW